MTASGLTGVDPGTIGAPAQQSAQTRAKVTRNEFLKILITQMKNQDPMNPLDNSEFLNQIMALENLEAVTALADGIRESTRLQNLVSASSLIGRTVRGIGGEGGLVAGIVTGAAINQDGSVDLILDGQTSLALRNVTDMRYTVTAGDIEE